MIPLIPHLLVDPLLDEWLREDLGRGDRTTQALFCRDATISQAQFSLKQSGVVAGLDIALRVFERLDGSIQSTKQICEGDWVETGTSIATLVGPSASLLMGERVALNLLMRLSGVATLTRSYVQQIEDLPTCLVDTRKTTPGLRLLEKYATQVGGARNHRYGLDDAIMLKDNHIQAAGSIQSAIAQVRQSAPYPLSIEVETETLSQVQEALKHRADIIMLDNMPIEQMRSAVQLIRQYSTSVKIEASGNITLSTIRQVAETGVDYISSSAPITQSPWLDISLRFLSHP